MKIKKDELKNLFLFDFISGIFVILILKMYNPKFINFGDLIDAVFSKDIMVLFYILGMIIFLIISYVSLFIGLQLVCSKTIGKSIRYLKELIGIYNLKEYDYCTDDCEFSNLDILLVVIYTLLIIPLMLYALLPAFAGALGLIVILCLVMQVLFN